MRNDQLAMGRALESMISGLETYIAGHRRMLESDIADDYLFGPEIVAIAKSLTMLLNGERGALDGGTAWRRIDAALKSAGFPAGLETVVGE